MYYLLSIFTGILIAVMVAVNGALTAQTGVYPATVIIHIVGLVAISIVCLIKRENPAKRRGLPIGSYLGGLIGVATTVFNNLSFHRISLSAIVALGLLGQAVCALGIDQFGWMHMPRRPFRPAKSIGLVRMLAGCGIMLYGTAFAAMPVIVSLLAGAGVVLSRTINARLSSQTSVTISTWFNYVVGLVFSVLALCLLDGQALAAFPALPTSPWVYAGGLLGVAVVLALNIAVSRISAFYMTLLLFVGQVFTGIAIDSILTQAFARANLAGGVLVALGMGLNLWLDAGKRAAKAP